jgi:nascent polypeptide-associated complex subunit alpha
LIPGAGRMDPRQMRLAMKRMGMQTEEMDDVTEVIIKRKGKQLRFVNPSVIYIKVSGQHIYQVIGEPETLEGEALQTSPQGPEFNREDIELVMSQTGCSEDEARQALMQTEGQPANAIIKILSEKKA